MLPTSAGVEPATSWSPVGQRIQLSNRGQLHPVWQGFLFIPLWIAQMLQKVHAISQAYDQTVWMRRLICLCWSHKSYCRFCRALAHISRGIDTLSREATLPEVFWLPSRKGPALKGANSVLLEQTPFRKRCSGMQIGSHESCLFCKNGSISIRCILSTESEWTHLQGRLLQHNRLQSLFKKWGYSQSKAFAPNEEQTLCSTWKIDSCLFFSARFVSLWEGSQQFSTQINLWTLKCTHSLFTEITTFFFYSNICRSVDKSGYQVNRFLDENVCCGYNLEMPRWGASNKYHNMFSLKNKILIDTFWLEKVPYQELWNLLFRFTSYTCRKA